jgi:hypothetical protein
VRVTHGRVTYGSTPYDLALDARRVLHIRNFKHLTERYSSATSSTSQPHIANSDATADASAAWHVRCYSAIVSGRPNEWKLGEHREFKYDKSQDDQTQRNALFEAMTWATERYEVSAWRCLILKSGWGWVPQEVADWLIDALARPETVLPPT